MPNAIFYLLKGVYISRDNHSRKVLDGGRQVTLSTEPGETDA